MSSNAREQIEYYRKYAEKFERSIWSLGSRDNRNHEIKISKIADAIGARDGGRVLEVGVGSGLHAQWLLDRTPVDYTGLDVSEQMLDVATKRLKQHEGRFRLGIADAHRLPIADGAFDATFCSGTLHHLRDPARGVAEIARTVRPGGRVALMEPNWKFPAMFMAGVIVPAERQVFRLNAQRMLQWARAAGVKNARLERVLYTPPKPATWGARFDRFDTWAATVPGLRRYSVMFFVTGTR